MTNIVVQDAQAWAEHTKLELLPDLDVVLEAQLSTQVLSELARDRDTSGWSSPATTPQLVRSIISMYYVAWVYRRTYAEDESTNHYASRLIGRADKLIDGILSGDLELEGELDVRTELNRPVFYPNDLSTAQEEPMNDQDTGWGGPAFTMGTVW